MKSAFIRNLCITASLSAFVISGCASTNSSSHADANVALQSMGDAGPLPLPVEAGAGAVEFASADKVVNENSSSMPAREAGVVAANAVASSPKTHAGASGISSLVAEAINDHPSIKAQRRLVDRAEAGVDSARWQFFPTPSASVEHVLDANSAGDVKGDKTVSTLRLQQPIWNGGRLLSQYRQAKAERDVSGAELGVEQQRIAIDVVQSYGEWLSARLKTDALRSGVSVYRGLAAQMRRRVSEGISPSADLVLVEGRLDLIQASLAVQEAQRAASLASLTQLLGRPITDSGLGVELKAPKTSKQSIAALVEAARSQSPMLKRLSAEIEVAEEGIAQARSVFSPDVYVRAERQYGNRDYEMERPSDRVMLGLQTNFGAGLSSVSELQGAQYRRDAALLRYRASDSSLEQQIATDATLAETLAPRISALRSATNATKDTRDSYDRQFTAGRKSWLDVMNAAREYMDAEIQLAEAEVLNLVVQWRLSILSNGLAQYASAENRS